MRSRKKVIEVSGLRVHSGPVRAAASLALLAMLALVFAVPGPAATWRDCSIQRQDANSVTLAVRLPRYGFEELAVDGTVYSEIRASGDLVPFAGEGEPDLPIYAVMLAVPRGGAARIESFTRSDETTVDGIRIAPLPRIEARGEGANAFADHIYEENESVYGADRPFPERTVWLGDRGRMRHQDVVRVFISPFVYEPLRGRLRVAGEVTVTITFESPLGLGGAPPEEDAWERVYEGTILNYEQGRRWRARRAVPLKTREVGNDRVKVLTDKTGIHRIAFDELSTAGFPDGIPIDDVYMYRDVFTEGDPDTINLVEVAIGIADNDQDNLLSFGDEITFFGRDFYDEFGYRGAEDMFFDKNVYWVSWDAGEHSTIGMRSGWREVSEPVKPDHFGDFVHMERDSVFCNFPPSADFDLFYWDRWKESFPFDLPGIHPDYPCTLIVNLVNFYLVNNYPRTGIIRLLARGCSGVMDTVDSRGTYLPGVVRGRYPLGPGYFCPEGNTFRIESDLEAGWTPGHTLDWFEVLYERRYEAHQDVLAFSSGEVTGELEYEITDFSNSEILLFDVTDPTSPVRLDVEPDMITPDAGTFTLTFRDTVGDEKHYFALCTTSIIDVTSDRLSMTGPPLKRDLLADYVIVSHPDFTGALDPLVEKRQAQGHAVTVATTEEVYDDFGNGMKSDVAVKRFIEHAFFGGGAQFVLLVGDANIDRKGRLNDPPPLQNQSDIDYLPSHNRILFDKFVPGNWEIRPNDNWFVMADGPEDVYPDLYLGRLPVGNTEELTGIINKILTFEDYEGADPWKKRLLVVSDDAYGDRWISHPTYKDCYTGQFHFKRACDSTAIIVTDFVPVALDTVKYYLERCTKDDQPDDRCGQGCCTDARETQSFTRSNCTPELIALLNQGGLLVNYQGHANRWQFTHEMLIHDQNYRTDIRSLNNADRPFIFIGFGCWISDFQWLAEPLLGDAIGEKFMLNSGGAACASFASGCSEVIPDNERFNDYVTRAFFTHLQGVDPQGGKNPARILMGEATMTALLRFGRTDYIQAHLLLADPAMVIDMGPPALTVSVDDSVIDETYVFAAETLDTLSIVAEVIDEEAIVSIGIELEDGGAATPVPADDYSTVALMDTGFAASRAYEITYDHIPLLGEYAIRLTCEDYSGKSVTRQIQIATGQAEFYADAGELGEGGQLVVGQKLRIVLTRPFAFGEADISVVVDTTAASEFEDYSVVMKDGEGKQWEVSFMPSLDPGDHMVTAGVNGFAAARTFEYVPAAVEFFADGIELLDGDYVAAAPQFEIVIKAEGAVSGEDVAVELDGQPVSVSWTPDTTALRGTFQLTDLTAGSHELAVQLFSVGVTRMFQVSDVLAIFDVSVFPNPFFSDTRFFYTLTQDVAEVELSIFTVSGRKVYETTMDPFAGYNEFVWDGRDHLGDRLANGTYLYKIVARSGSGDREFTGWVVKVE
jgi:hypothetical protein